MAFGLDADPWLYAAFGAFVAVHLGVLFLLLRQTGQAGPATGRSPVESVPSDRADGSTAQPSGSDNLPPISEDQVVQCPHCGVQNATDFRFCRYCVGELSGGTRSVDADEASSDRQMF